ncbi:hypothetical protein K505DRAFT_359368 [Melanomma pulvis-pyrius CBS 109.77]|uniref:C2H2-type domain-containing protein n=1 Tax=Melanomma pulvis-pyrius CBS 109.77 TaxID=1314802 RepID=A0A6A6XIR2_9PLEO|nr:hypothetical protein K505DRAFT_359368 [Melanomma pulvis-pyrius CBS 109.77]
MAGSLGVGPFEDATRMINLDQDSSRPSFVNTKQNMQIYGCVVCGKQVDTYAELSQHAFEVGHETLRCRIQPCDLLYARKNGVYRAHMKTSHPELYKCRECNTSFNSQFELEFHASRLGHALFICGHPWCGKPFGRLDTFQRHQRTHQKDTKRFPCKYCNKYRGSNGFKRKDHLTQHLRGYHHIGERENASPILGYACTQNGCPMYNAGLTYWGSELAFKKRSDLIEHMKTVHDTSKYPCPEPGCDRVAGRGYFRPADLRFHLKKVHWITNSDSQDIAR